MNISAAFVAATLICLGTLRTGAAVATASSPPCAGANLSPSAANSASVGAATLCLIDQVRTARRLRSLRSNGVLRTIAASQVNDMVRWNYFADNRPPGLTPFSLIATTRYPVHTRGLSIGQNIGWGTGEYATPACMVAAWMASPGHRAIILTRGYRDAGVGVAPAIPPVLGQELPGATYAIEFGARGS